MRHVLVVSLLFITSLLGFADEPSSGKVHVYYIAADEVDWDYAPSGIDQMTGRRILLLESLRSFS